MSDVSTVKVLFIRELIADDSEWNEQQKPEFETTFTFIYQTFKTIVANIRLLISVEMRKKNIK